jgi:transcriptional regulator with XRE-family HTH domain
MTMTGAPKGATLSEQVAEEIRAMMARRRITGAALARRLDVSPAWVSYRLTGVQPIDLNDLQAIADVLDVDPRAVPRRSSYCSATCDLAPGGVPRRPAAGGRAPPGDPALGADHLRRVIHPIGLPRALQTTRPGHTGRVLALVGPKDE